LPQGCEVQVSRLGNRNLFSCSAALCVRQVVEISSVPVDEGFDFALIEIRQLCPKVAEMLRQQSNI
jgi:hypothetical protein